MKNRREVLAVCGSLLISGCIFGEGDSSNDSRSVVTPIQATNDSEGTSGPEGQSGDGRESTTPESDSGSESDRDVNPADGDTEPDSDDFADTTRPELASLTVEYVDAQNTNYQTGVTKIEGEEDRYNIRGGKTEYTPVDGPILYQNQLFVAVEEGWLLRIDPYDLAVRGSEACEFQPAGKPVGVDNGVCVPVAGGVERFQIEGLEAGQPGDGNSDQSRPESDASEPTGLNLDWGTADLYSGKEIVGLASYANSLYLSRADGVIHRIDQEGNEVWRLSVGSSLSDVPSFYGQLGYALTGDGNVVAFNASGGFEVFEREFSVTPVGSISIVDGYLSFSSRSGKVRMIDPHVGAEYWTREVDDLIVSTPVSTQSIVVIAGQQALYGFQTDTGRQVWNLGLDSDITHSIVGGGDLVYSVTESKTLFGVDIHSGEVELSFQINQNPVDQPLVTSGALFMMGPGGEFLSRSTW